MGRTFGHDSPLGQENEPVTVARGQVEIVNRRNGRQAVVNESSNQRQDLELMQDIKI